MPYTLTQASDVLAIAEQQYGTAETIKFTMFTSCIGVIARKGTQVTGVHLVVVGEDGTLFDDAAARLTIDTLGQYTQVVVIGLIDVWRTQVPAFQTLLNGLHSPVLIEVDDGMYGGRVSGGKFQTLQDTHWVDVP